MLKNLIILLAFIFIGNLKAQIWESQIINPDVTLFDVHAFSGDKVIAIGNKGNFPNEQALIYKTEDAGASWDTVHTVDNGRLFEMQFVDSQTGWIVGWQEDSIFGIPYTITLKTTDGGANWISDAVGLGEGQGFAISMINQSIGWVLAETNQLFETIVRCRSTGMFAWQDSCILPGIPLNSKNDIRDIFFLNDDLGWISVKATDSLHLTTDGGINWLTVPLPMQLSPPSKVYFFEAQNGWVLEDGGSALRSTDGGLNWSIEPQLNGILDMQLAHSTGTAVGWAVGRNGVLLQTMDGGGLWEQRSVTSNDLRGLSFVDADTGYVVGSEGLVLKTVTGGMTGIEIPEPEQLASGITLYANYPNPFNPSTTLRFELQRRSEVLLQITDVSGRHVRTLVSNVYFAGLHEVKWDGRDETGTPVASGVYLSRLESMGAVQSQKVLLVR